MAPPADMQSCWCGHGWNALARFARLASFNPFPWSWTFNIEHIIYVNYEYFSNQKKGNVMKYTTFCTGIN